MAQSLCKAAGLVFLIVGVAGFAVPNLFGFHLTPIHNVIHIATGAVAAYLGFAGTYAASKTFCVLFGAVYLLLGIAGFAAPGLIASVIGHPGPVTSADLMVDNVFHAVVGLVFLGAGVSKGR
jgi:hypothetical protein